MAEITQKKPEVYEDQATYDEITFALFYDGELDDEESKRFEEALSQSESLSAQYGEWIAARDALYDHFEALEASYPLDGFSDQVMNALPNRSPWAPPKEQRIHSIPTTSTWRSWFTPILIGGLTAAAILLIAQSLNRVTSQTQRSTVLINYPEQGDEAQKSPVIWLVEEEESVEDAEADFETESRTDKDDI